MRKFLFPILLFITSFSFAQRVDLDREYFTASYIQLPSHPIADDSKRTYTTNNDAVSVAGFSKMSTGGTLEINYSFMGTILDDFRIESNKHEKKDKDGKVISTRYSYTVQATYKSTAELNVTNMLTGEHYNKTYRETFHKSSRSFNSRGNANRYFEDNRYSFKNKYRLKHIRSTEEKARNYVNDRYGYPVYNARDKFWILGNKKHPEFNQHMQAFNDAKRIMANIIYNKPVDTVEKELQPVINYFIETVKKYPGKKKKMRKMRYASYYNLAKIYYYLDNATKVRAYGQKIIDNNYDKKYGKRFIKDADYLQERFNLNGVNTRHFEVLTEDLTDAYSNRADEVVEEEAGEEILAYLITMANDTIQATIPKANIRNIIYAVDLEVSDDLGNTQVKHYKAADCKTLALTNEDMYQVVDFNEAKKGANSTAVKFVKVLFESDKIQLFLFNEKELVLKRPNDSKGKSTMSSDFAFGFNKKLGDYAGGCEPLLARTKSKEFKNTQESLLAFCEALDSCK